MPHTPGPWRLVPQHATDEGQYIEDTIWHGDPGSSKHIAVVRCGLAETEDNARLIAAAPDLLEACKEVLRSIRAGSTIGGTILERAIAKAEGH